MNMQTVVYRKIATSDWTRELHAGTEAGKRSPAGMPASARDTCPLSPELFYPVVTEPEMVTWTHWLPTAIVFDRSRLLSPLEVISTLTKLNAPPEVLEEFHWSWKMGLFEAYEVRTPVRRDARDPLLLGRLGGQPYRLALWGESLLPQEEITALVQKSLAIKARAARCRTGLTLGGTLLGFALGVCLGYLSEEGQPLAVGVFFALLSFFFAWFPLFLYSPENRQHDFLDRYRC
jgi:hypothetical protein